MEIASKTQQLPLFDEDVDTATRKAGFSDPAFGANKTLPVHRWVPWVAGFSSQFVQDVIDKYMPAEDGIILDPFAGVGTTLVEANLMGYDAIGFEINPYAALACQVKASAHRVTADELHSELKRFKVFLKETIRSDYTPSSKAPEGFNTRSEFYSPQVLRKVLIVRDFVGSVKDPKLKDLFRLAFASTMIRYSNYSYEPSLGTRAAAGKSKIEDFPVEETIVEKMGAMVADIKWIQHKEKFSTTTTKVIKNSFLQFGDHLSANSIDLAITSPPYLNNYHYVRNTRPQLYWLGYADKPKDTKTLEYDNLGKYWQTVRSKDAIKLNFSLPSSDLEERLEELRALNPEKGVYGGKGWANYAASYFNDSQMFARGLKYGLKPGGFAFVVIGNSILQGINIPTDLYFGQIAEMEGLEFVDIHVPRDARTGNSIIQSEVRVGKAKDSESLYEAVVELRKG